MEIQRHHWVGLAAGVPLFSGAWLAAIYNNGWWGILGLLITGFGVYMANHVEVRRDRMTHVLRGIVSGGLAALVARILGAISMSMMHNSHSINFTNFGDTLRVILAGNWYASLLLIVLGAIVGGIITAFESEAEGEK